MGHDTILLIEILRADQKCDKRQDLATFQRKTTAVTKISKYFA